MKHFAGRLILCLALGASVGASAAAPEWEKFAPAGAGFSVTMPGKPTGSQQEVPAGLGKLINHVYVLESGQTVYVLSYADFPEPVSDPAAIKAMLDSARDEAMSATNGQLKEEKEIKLDGHPGREWYVGLPGGRARARAYWVSRRLYQAVVLMPEGKDAAAERARETVMSKFLDSFALTGAGSSQ